MVRFQKIKHSHVYTSKVLKVLFLPFKIVIKAAILFIKFLITIYRKVIKRRHYKVTPKFFVRSRRFNFFLWLVFIITVFIIWFANSSFFNIKEVNLSWDTPEFSLPETQSKFITGFRGKNILFLRGSEALKVKKTVLEIEDLDVIKRYPSTLSISIKTREPILEVMTLGVGEEASMSSILKSPVFLNYRQSSDSADSYLIDKTGFIFWKLIKVMPSLPRFFIQNGFKPTVGLNLTRDEDLAGLNFFLEQSTQNSDASLPKVSFLLTDPDRQLLVKYDGGPYVFLPVIKSYSGTVTTLKLIFSKYRIEGKNLKKVDLRFNNPVVEY